MDKTFCGAAVKERLLIDSFLSGSEHERDVNCFISRSIYRTSCYSPNESRRIQASRKPVSAPRSWSFRTKASLSSSVNFIARCANTSGFQWYAWLSTSDSSSGMSSIVADQLFGRRVVGFCRFFFVGQSRARWPCLPHLKHRPVLRYSSFSRSVLAFRAAADVSIAFGSCGGRRCHAGCWRLPWFPCPPCVGRRQ